MTLSSDELARKLQLPRPCLMLVTDRSLCRGMTLAEAVRHALEAGVNAVQFREKDLPAGEQLMLASQIALQTKGKALFIVNDRADVALALDAEGVQLPESGLPVAEARKVVGEGKLIGRSVHTLVGAREAESAGADYVVFGPIYETGSHPGQASTGLEKLEEVVDNMSIPVLAIGGITAQNIRETLQSGAAGVAVMSPIMAAADPRAAAIELFEALSRNPTRTSDTRARPSIGSG